MSKSKSLISIIIPVYFNEDSLRELHKKMCEVVGEIKQVDYEFIYVNDGSEDESLTVLKEIQKNDRRRTKVVNLSRNFGSFNAIMAGMSIAKGDAIMDLTADLQDDPKLIKKLSEQWLKGLKVVLAVREEREDGFISNMMSNLFYSMMRKWALPDMPKGGFDIFMIDRVVVDLILKMDEKNSSLVGQILWTGFKRKLIFYTRKERKHGKSRWTMRKKVKYLIDSLLAFSYVPIRFMTTLGVITAFISVIYLVIIILSVFLNFIEVPGWSSLAVIFLFFSSIQMIMLGIIGEYLWRTNDESKSRPNFIIDEVVD